MSRLLLALARGNLAAQVKTAANFNNCIRAASVVHGDLNALAPKIKQFVQKHIDLCQPDKVHICDGSDKENKGLIEHMVSIGMLEPLPKYDNCWYCRTDPADVARVESKTSVCSRKREDTIADTKEGVKNIMGNWLSPDQFKTTIAENFTKCMTGRTMYVIPFSMGPVGSPLSKYGIQLSDSPYVTASMRVMTRVGTKILDQIGNDDFVPCIHSLGQPLPMKTPLVNNWPCNPPKTLISHFPETNEILSFGSGYGGNALLGKKCFALRIGSTIARSEGWLAEHMLILGLTNPQGKKRYIAAAFPSQCGKTNLAMMNPNIPGFKLECVGDDIAWMRFVDGELRAINPEYGFFGVAPGTSYSSNPNAMDTIFSNTIFTNTAKTSDGGVFWEGLEKETPKDVKITSWLGQENWTKESGKPASHPNARFCAPAGQCPVIDPKWEDPAGVRIDAILFGGRRPEGVPLVYEAFDWKHGVMIGAAMRSETTSAAEFKGKAIMHDPFAMRPFMGYNFGKYLAHWLSMEKDNRKLPKIFHVNWFRTGSDGKFIWPGFGENARVLDWVMRRCDGEDSAIKTPIGYIPKDGAINMDGLSGVDMKELNRLPKDFWLQECVDIKKFFDEQVGGDLPGELDNQLSAMKDRVTKM